jgi:aldehyde dehydrogenase (NAD+)
MSHAAQSPAAGAYGLRPYTTPGASTLRSYSPIDNSLLGEVITATTAEYDQVVEEAHATFLTWRSVPAPKRGLLIRDIADALREHKSSLAELVTREMGKILAEGEGEIQEAIDIADYAVGLSRQLCGQTMHSERPSHRMYEHWHPLGVVGVITAFNFPAAVWAWNAMIAAVCGNTVLWKPSEHTPLTAIAMNSICREVAERHGFPGLFSLVIGSGKELGQRLAADRCLPLISATGSCEMGREVGEIVARRLGRTLLELGGNNAVIILEDADLSLAVPSTVFGAAGTAGQRCTTTRRAIVHERIESRFCERMVAAYRQLRIGDPLQSGVLMGPLINRRSVDAYTHAIERARAEGGEVLYGGEVVPNLPSDLYVQPTIIRAHRDMSIVREETFAPILYVIPVSSVQEAIEVNNSVPQGLSSSIFTTNLKSAERFLSHSGSDCGIANVNLGTSGAEIGGAFGGEKDTGGGREAGSESWKQYMRRQTTTINYSDELPLAQGIKFELAP